MRRLSRTLGVTAISLATAAALVAAPAVANAHVPAGGDVYVSPFGSDHFPGTRLLPVRTLTRARDLVRARDQHLTADLTVHVASGTYRLHRPLPPDSPASRAHGHRGSWPGDPAPAAH